MADGLPEALAVLIVAQAAHETNGFTSNVFLTCKNAFGYKWVGQSTAAGPCLSSPELDSYAGYATLEDSVHEITAWIRRRAASGAFPADLSSIATPDYYAQLLKSAGYYGDTVENYTQGLVYWLGQVTAKLNTETVSIILLLLALGILAYRKKIFPSLR